MNSFCTDVWLINEDQSNMDLLFQLNENLWVFVLPTFGEHSPCPYLLVKVLSMQPDLTMLMSMAFKLISNK